MKEEPHHSFGAYLSGQSYELDLPAAPATHPAGSNREQGAEPVSAVSWMISSQTATGHAVQPEERP